MATNVNYLYYFGYSFRGSHHAIPDHGDPVRAVKMHLEELLRNR